VRAEVPPELLEVHGAAAAEGGHRAVELRVVGGLAELVHQRPDLGVISDCHFRTPATEYYRKPGIKWLSGTEK
jgi:hypothetical protein